MSWWGDRTVAKRAPIGGAIDRVAELHARMGLAKAVLDALNAEILEFRAKHGLETDRLDQIIKMRGDSIAARARVAPLWRALQARKNRALHEFSRAQRVWSDAKMEANHHG